jgi:hypothetical protein
MQAAHKFTSRRHACHGGWLGSLAVTVSDFVSEASGSADRGSLVCGGLVVSCLTCLGIAVRGKVQLHVQQLYVPLVE